MLDAGCWMLDAGYWMLDAGCWMLDAGCKMLGMSVAGLKDKVLGENGKHHLPCVVSLVPCACF